MMEKLLNNRAQTVLKQAMDASSLRNNVIADNIANAETPNFKRSEVIFEQKMKKVLEKSTNTDKLKLTDSRHIPIAPTTSNSPIEVKKLEDSSYRNDENNVDIDVEMANMSKNKIYYDAVSQSMSNEIKLLRMAIIGRG